MRGGSAVGGGEVFKFVQALRTDGACARRIAAIREAPVSGELSNEVRLRGRHKIYQNSSHVIFGDDKKCTSPIVTVPNCHKTNGSADITTKIENR